MCGGMLYRSRQNQYVLKTKHGTGCNKRFYLNVVDLKERGVKVFEYLIFRFFDKKDK